MAAVLGIDAAWTDSQPSGVALIADRNGGWEVLRVAPSYSAFIDDCSQWHRDGKLRGGPPNVSQLFDVVRNLDVEDVDIVALDIPLAYSGISGRRPSDIAVSKAYGSKGCSTHSPSFERPGPVSDQLLRQLRQCGYELQTTSRCTEGSARAIEVYPHPALLTLTKSDYRVPYKVSKSLKYWPKTSIAERVERVLAEFAAIASKLHAEFGDLGFELPAAEDVSSLSHLKRFEDTIDALVCAWAGKEHLLGNTRAYGDADSTIWIPE